MSGSHEVAVTTRGGPDEGSPAARCCDDDGCTWHARYEAALLSESAEVVCQALVDVALGGGDWRWIQAKCLFCAEHSDWSVRAISATCLGHLVRLHGNLEPEKVFPALATLLADSRTEGYARDALADVGVYRADLLKSEWQRQTGRPPGGR